MGILNLIQLMMTYPTDTKFPITQNFGVTEFSKEKGSEIYDFFGGKHPGIDIALEINSSIYSCLDGVVVSREYHRGMGKTLRIRTGCLLHIYGHLNDFKKDFGDHVKEGEMIALSGNTVAWTMPHLHFEIRDLTVWEVKDRPFKPTFEPGFPKQYQISFEYVCNHNEALIDLALKYYGTEQGIEVIKSNNNTLMPKHTHIPLPSGTVVRIV